MRLSATCMLSAIAALVATSALCKEPSPPRIPHIDHELTDEELAKLPKLEQSPALKRALTELAQGSIEDRKAKLKVYVLSHLVFVQGGSFQMGDFGPIWHPAKLPFTENKDDKALHKVTLTGYSIQAYKTTYAEFDIYADAMRTTRAGMDEANDNGAYRNPYVPAGLYWSQANDYCQWLGKLTGLPFGLPTEAQWEYAARSRGKFFAFSTDNGNIDSGRNIADPRYRTKLVPESSRDSTYRLYEYAVGLFPPSPLGIYDMGANGFEWVHDYYDADYYTHSIENDPTGPDKGNRRVARGYDPGSNFYGGVTMLRRGEDPMLIEKNLITGMTGPAFSADHGVRCVVNQANPTPK